MAEIFLSIGSNIEPAKHFAQCAKALDALFSDSIWSPVYQSAAVGLQGDDFYNAVVKAQTRQSIESTIITIKHIEKELGRKREANKFSSRPIDIDLLFYNDTIISTADVTLPREEIASAPYVLIPLVELAPDVVHPENGKTFQALLHELLEQQPDLATGFKKLELSF